MQVKPTISIIIPVYNCETFIGVTLDSIITQTYVDWECILVDDHSKDNVLVLLKEYEEKDSRFRVYSRPLSIQKGANSCRNFGFTKASGNYIKWFDCDDIMLPLHLEISFLTLKNNNLDFVITDTINFDHVSKKILNPPFEFNKENVSISLDSLVLNEISWITDDFLGSREFVQSTQFNQNIATLGDELNFFVRLLHQPFKALYINIPLTHRRVHINSISSRNGLNTENYTLNMAVFKFQTALDLVKYDNEKLIRWYLSGYMQYAFKLALANKKIPHSTKAFILIRKYYSFGKALAFIASLLIGKYNGKGYVVMKYARS